MPLGPTVIESSARSGPEYDSYSRLLNVRVISLGTPIDDKVSNLIVAQFLLLEA